MDLRSTLPRSEGPIAAYMVACLDQRGLLSVSPEEAAARLGVALNRVLARGGGDAPARPARGFPAARRTVAKYRGQLAIPSAGRRPGNHDQILGRVEASFVPGRAIAPEAEDLFGVATAPTGGNLAKRHPCGVGTRLAVKGATRPARGAAPDGKEDRHA